MTLLDLAFARVDVPTHVDAPCLDNGEDWHAESAADRARAALACDGCPIALECLAGALTRREVWGVWGGVDLETELKGSERAAVRARLLSYVDNARGGALTH